MRWTPVAHRASLRRPKTEHGIAGEGRERRNTSTQHLISSLEQGWGLRSKSHREYLACGSWGHPPKKQSLPLPLPPARTAPASLVVWAEFGDPLPPHMEQQDSGAAGTD